MECSEGVFGDCSVGEVGFIVVGFSFSNGLRKWGYVKEVTSFEIS